MNAYEIIRAPLVSEKSLYLQNTHNTYTFEVHQDANKVQVRDAIERLFKVKVSKVTTQNVLGKNRRRGKVEGQAPCWKKAMVTLRDGQTIEGL